MVLVYLRKFLKAKVAYFRNCSMPGIICSIHILRSSSFQFSLIRILAFSHGKISPMKTQKSKHLTVYNNLRSFFWYHKMGPTMVGDVVTPPGPSDVLWGAFLYLPNADGNGFKLMHIPSSGRMTSHFTGCCDLTTAVTGLCKIANAICFEKIFHIHIYSLTANDIVYIRYIEESPDIR